MATPTQNQIDIKAIQTAICGGVVEGNKPLIEALLRDATKRHDVRNSFQAQTDKIYEIDGELKLVKGMLNTLMGSGDGNGGIVNRIDRDMGTLTEDVSALKSQVSEINRKMDKVIAGNEKSSSFMDGWKGVAMALGIIATCITAIGGMIGAMVFLFSHGLKP